MPKALSSGVPLLSLKLPELSAKRAVRITAPYAILAGILVLAAFVRLLPAKWGLYLNEYDPYIQYKAAKYAVEHGFSEWFNWYDNTRWYPWGVAAGKTLYPGVPFSVASSYLILKWLGIDVTLFDVAVFFPVVMGVLTVLVVFLLGRELGGVSLGLIAALMLSVAPTFSVRTSLGFCDTETVGFFSMILSLFLFARALDRKPILYGILSGLALGLMTVSWGAYLFLYNLYAIFLVVALLLKKYDFNLGIAYVSTILVGVLSASFMPKLIKFVTSISAFLPFFGIVLVVIAELYRRYRGSQIPPKLVLGIIVAVAASGLALSYTGVIRALKGKFLATVDPFAAVPPIIRTVGEQLPSTWATFFSDYRFLLLFMPIGLYFMIRRLQKKDLLLALLGLTSIYVASSFVRLTIFTDLAVSLIGGAGFIYLMTRSVSAMQYQELAKKGKRRSSPFRGYALLSIAILVVLTAPSIAANVTSANMPVVIAALPDWRDALAWMRDNLPPGAVVGCWWDYGYWINVMANKTTVADNNTLNSTQIKLLAIAFLSDENVAIDIYRKLGIQYVVVYDPFYTGPALKGLPGMPWGTYGEFVKSFAMMTIAGYNSSDYINYGQLTVQGQKVYLLVPNGPKAANATLFKLLFYPWILYGDSDYLKQVEEEYGVTFTPPKHFELIYHSPNRWVMVYKVLYPEEGAS